MFVVNIAQKKVTMENRQLICEWHDYCTAYDDDKDETLKKANMIILRDAIAGKLFEVYETGLKQKSIALTLETVKVFRLIEKAGYLPVEPVQLEVLGNEEIRKYYLGSRLSAVKDAIQATIAHNEAKFGKLYRKKE